MAKRIADEPAFVLHRYDFSESSLILEVLTRHHGRIALLAKGVKRPSSNFRPVLLPLQRLHIAFGGDAEIRTLKSAEWTGGQAMPDGEVLLSGYYLNELMMRLLARDDPHPRLFDAYAATVEVLTGEHSQALEAALRAFELLLLRETGVLPELDRMTMTQQALQPNLAYALRAEAGLVPAGNADGGLHAATCQALQMALDADDMSTLRQACGLQLPALRLQLRGLLHYHLGSSQLRSRAAMLEVRRLLDAPTSLHGSR